MRTISHSEVATALDCWAKHAFAYTGALSDGDALASRTVSPMLRDGRAWGAAVAAFHQTGSGHAALVRSLQADADEQREQGLYSEGDFAATVSRLTRMLDHYSSTVERLPLLDIEHELLVPIPSRRSRRASTKYRLHCFLDGVHRDVSGRVWIVEFKLRKRLSSDQQIALSRQTRWYAWAWARATGEPPAGVIADERLNDEPKAVRINQDGKPSKVQNCTPQQYELACRKAQVEPEAEVLAALNSKDWQKRTTIMFRPGELEEAGWQLVSAAQLVQQLDSGVLYPVRNPSPTRCPGCEFNAICQTPDDVALVDVKFRRTTPKWRRLPIATGREAA